MPFIYSPLIITFLYLFIQFQYLKPQSLYHSTRSPASIKKSFQDSISHDFQNESTYILTSPLVISDHLNKIRTRLNFLNHELNAIRIEKSSCLNQTLCDNFQQVENIMINELEALRVEATIALEGKINQINISSKIKMFDPPESCSAEAFLPDLYDPIKVVQLNFHFPVRDNKFSPGMFVEDHDGLGNTNYTVFNHIDHLIKNTNSHLETNQPSNRESFSDVSAPPIKFRVRKKNHNLPRIPSTKNGYFQSYYHFSSSYQGGLLDSLNKIKDGSIFNLSNDGINLVFQEQYGSAEWKPPVYALDDNGERILTSDGQGQVLEEFIRFKIINGNAIEKLLPVSEPPLVVMANEWMGYAIHQKIWNYKMNERSNDIESQNFNLWERAKLIVEALGFVGGLDYIWINSNKTSESDFNSCIDHPTYQSNPWCGASATNNIMDSNCYKNSWSPCQLAIVHHNYFNYLKHLLYLPSEADHDYDHYIPENLGDIYWDAPHDLIGDVYIGEGTTLHIGCQVTKPFDAQFFPETRVQGLDKVINR